MGNEQTPPRVVAGSNRCRVPNCAENHAKHYCRACKADNADHKASQCTGGRTNQCKAQGCFESHSKHYCRVCGDKDANHIAKKCTNPSSQTLYHGTTLVAANAIMESYMKPSGNGTIGKGIYFATTFDNAKNIAIYRSSNQPAAVLECKVYAEDGYAKKNNHGAWANIKTNFQEVCVPDHARIRILRMINV